MADRDGNVFDGRHLVPFVLKHGVNPATGAPVARAAIGKTFRRVRFGTEDTDDVGASGVGRNELGAN
jgi:hypothetical protein